MNFQILLLLLIAFLIGKHWYPDYVYPAIVVGLIVWGLNCVGVKPCGPPHTGAYPKRRLRRHLAEDDRRP